MPDLEFFIWIDGVEFRKAQFLSIQSHPVSGYKDLFTGGIVLPKSGLSYVEVKIRGIDDIRIEDNEVAKIRDIFIASSDPIFVREDYQGKWLKGIITDLSFAMDIKHPYIMEWEATFLGSDRPETIKVWGEK